MNMRGLYDVFKTVGPSPTSISFETTQEILTKLKLIGALKPGEKLDVRNLKIENNTILTPLKRMFFGNGRDATFAFCCNTIDRSFSILFTLAITNKTSECMICKHILLDMENAIEGLKNVQITYKDDKMFFCNIETLVQTIQAKVIDVHEKYPCLIT
jgi:hypothetical protein